LEPGVWVTVTPWRGGSGQVDVVGARSGPADHPEPVGQCWIGRRCQERSAQRDAGPGLHRVITDPTADDLG
jgi:hypothetical protein